jgi:chaperonin cofactor prefoldin
MTENGHIIINTDNDIRNGLDQIKTYLETHIRDLTNEAGKKDNEIAYLKEALDKARHQMEGNSQLINKLLGELSKLQNDIEWYKWTYEKRSFLGTIREKLLRKH